MVSAGINATTHGGYAGHNRHFAFPHFDYYSMMCGRFYLDVSKTELMAHYALQSTPDISPRFNIAPSQEILAVRALADNERNLGYLRWGLIPSWSKEEHPHYSMINARADTVAIKPAFRAAFKHRRCLIPASGFYEWQPQKDFKQPYAISMQDDVLFSLAGLWEHWESADGRVIESCAIVVTDANEVLKRIHDRMPVIIAPEDYSTWLDPDIQDKNRLTPLLHPYSAQLMKAYPVSTRINNPGFDNLKCIQPIS